jgi:hypothetical protein
MSSAQSSALRFLFFWWTFSLIPFGIAALLTVMIVKVHRNGELDLGAPIQEIAVYTRGEKTPQSVSVDYMIDNDSKESAIRIWAGGIPRGGAVEVFLNNVAGRNACVNDVDKDYGDALGFRAFPVHNLTRPQEDDAWVVLYFPYKLAMNLLSIRCRLKSVVQPETYTTRRLKFYSEIDSGNYSSDGQIPDLQGGMQIGNPAHWILSLSGEGLENITFRSGNHIAGGVTSLERISDQQGMTRDFVPGDLIEARWASVRAESIRDIYLVIIGGLVALGAAMLVEGCRPFVERLILAPHPEPGPNSHAELPPENA